MSDWIVIKGDQYLENAYRRGAPRDEVVIRTVVIANLRLKNAYMICGVCKIETLSSACRRYLSKSDSILRTKLKWFHFETCRCNFAEKAGKNG